jgi:hypothetical protein
MSRENRQIVRTSVAVVIAACLLKVAVVGVGWDDTTADTTAHPVSEQVTLDDVAPATKSCGDFFRPPGRIPIRVEVVEGNIPCRVARRVMNDRYRQLPTGLWSCGGGGLGVGSLFTECEKNRGRQGTIRARLYCPYWGPYRSLCSRLLAALRRHAPKPGRAAVEKAATADPKKEPEH